MNILAIYPNKTRKTLRINATRSEWLTLCAKMPPRVPCRADSMYVVTFHLTEGDKYLDTARCVIPYKGTDK
jgi:hypothetical protein